VAWASIAVNIALSLLNLAIAAASGSLAVAAIPQGDEEVDALYNQIYRELICFILEDPQTIEQANHLMWAAHNLERTADRVINLCERVVYTVTGELAELGTDDSGIESIA
jgi:phosphate transport system protein